MPIRNGEPTGDQSNRLPSRPANRPNRPNRPRGGRTGRRAEL